MVRTPMQKSMVEWAEELEVSAAVASGVGEADAAAANAEIAKLLRGAHQTAQALMVMHRVLAALRQIVPGGEDEGRTLAEHLRHLVDHHAKCMAMLVGLESGGVDGCCPYCEADGDHATDCDLAALLLKDPSDEAS